MASSSAITSLGVGSNLDLGSLLDNLKTSEQARLKPLATREASSKAQLSAYGTVQSALGNLKAAADGLNKSALFQSTSAAVSGEAFTAKTAEDAVPGRYSVQVNQLARAQSLYSAGVASSSDPIGAGGTLDIKLGGADGNSNQSVSIDLIAGDTSLEGVRDAINKADIGVSASIINDGGDSPYRLILSSNVTGTDNQISVTARDNTALADLVNYDSAAKSGSLTQPETGAAADAQLTVNGIPITRSSNTVADAIQGVTLSLDSTTESAESVSVARDDAGIKKAINTFVSAYNSFQKVADKLTGYNSETDIGGLLNGDSTMRSVESSLRGVLNTAQSDGAFSGLAQIGVSLQKDGNTNDLIMAVDDDVLSAALADKPADVAALFSGASDSVLDTDGVAGTLAKAIDNLTSDNGTLGAATAGTKRRISDTQDRMESMQVSIDATIERYRQQFVALDSLVSSLNSTKSYLTSQFDALNGGNNK